MSKTLKLDEIEMTEVDEPRSRTAPLGASATGLTAEEAQAQNDADLDELLRQLTEGEEKTEEEAEESAAGDDDDDDDDDDDGGDVDLDELLRMLEQELGMSASGAVCKPCFTYLALLAALINLHHRSVSTAPVFQ